MVVKTKWQSYEVNLIRFNLFLSFLHVYDGFVRFIPYIDESIIRSYNFLKKI